MDIRIKACIIPTVCLLLLNLLLGCSAAHTPGVEPTARTSPTSGPTSTAWPAPTLTELLTATAPTRQPATPPPSPSAKPTEPQVAELRPPMIVDSEAGRLYLTAVVDSSEQILALATDDGRLLATYGVSGTFAVDSAHGWLYVDQGNQGLAVLDVETGALHALVSLPAGSSWVTPAPQADPASGRVLAFRDNTVFWIDPQEGTVTRTIPFDVQAAGGSCGTGDGPLPIQDAEYDSRHGILYLEFLTYVCTPWTGYTIVSYDMATGSEIARKHGSGPEALPVAFDGYLYGSSWYRLGIGYRWALRDGRPWIDVSDWQGGFARFQVDARRGWLYEATGVAKGLRVLDRHTMALILLVPLPFEGQLVGYDPKTDQLYFLNEGQLGRWLGSAIRPPTPEPLAVTEPPTSALRSLLVSPDWTEDRTLFGIWDVGIVPGECWVLNQVPGQLYASHDAGRTWGQPRGGLRGGCGHVTALAVSPDYAHDRTLLAGIAGLGIFKSSDSGRLWQPSNAGLMSMGIRQILLSPGFGDDEAAFAQVVSSGELYRSTDGGSTWEALGVDFHLVAMSPEFDQDRTLLGIAYGGEGSGDELHVSRDGGGHWERVGEVPADATVSLLSMSPLFEKWGVILMQANDGKLYRSDDGGVYWDHVLTTAPPDLATFPGPERLVYAPDIEVNRPVFLVTSRSNYSTVSPSRHGVLYQSGDGGVTWREVLLPEDITPTAVAISPSFAQDGLVFVGTADGRVITLRAAELQLAG